MQLSNPEVVTSEIDGKLMEPVELVVVDVPDTFIGVVTERLGARRGRMVKMHNPGFGRARLEFRVPVARPHRLPRRVPHVDARHRPAQHDVRRLGAVGRPMMRRAERRHRLRPSRRGDAVRAAPPPAARRLLHHARATRSTRA